MKYFSQISWTLSTNKEKPLKEIINIFQILMFQHPNFIMLTKISSYRLNVQFTQSIQNSNFHQ